MNYQVGQAVILYGKLWFVTHVSGTAVIDLKNWHNQYELVNSLSEGSLRPATEAEILAEAQKHGWKPETGHIDSPTGWIRLYDTNTDPCHIWGDPRDADEMEALGKELITASRIERALKLVP